jgi:YD repeat-containing protein
VGAKDPNNAAVSIETTESWAYDKVGNVIRHTDVRGQREWFAHDKANRVVRYIDQGGYVTVTTYTSNQYSMTRYTDSVGVSATDDTWAQTGQAPTPTQSLYITAVTMDRANRKMREITISFVPGITPTLSAYIYDALGRLRHEARPGNSQTISRSYDAGDRLISETFAEGTAAATTTQYGYDALGNQIRIIDARGVALAESDGEWARTERRRLGYVDAQGNGRLAANLSAADRAALRALYTTTQQFDTTGRKLAVTDALGATTRTAYNAQGDIVTITDALGKIGYFYTDALGRVTLQVGPDGAVTRTTFDLLGNQTATRQYANRLVNQGAVTNAVRPQIVTSASGVTGPYVLESTADAQQIAVFDALGRTSTIQTWYGAALADHYTETFAYDAAGNVLSATARNGALTTYQYDALGRKTREVLPVTSKNASGVATAVENRYAYDSEGHLAQKIEAYGLPEQRTTTYEYDGLGRQIRQTGDTLTVFDPAAQTSSVVTPTATRSYDLAGNLLEEIDAAGARTLHFYDAANREVGRVDALGYYTAWTYDPVGNKVAETRYANAVSTSGGATLGTGSAIQVLTTAPASGTNAVYVLANADQDRAITYRYDSQGRQIETRIANLEYGLYTQGSYQARIGDAVTRTEYDALGNVIRQTDANGNVTRSYYNAAGQKVGQLDAAGYLTVWTFDAQGRTTKQTRYANQVANWASSSGVQRNLLTLAGMSGALANATQDRVTDYTHDALGRLLTETAKGVNAGTLDANGVLQAGTVADALTTYTYNGLDKVTSRTDATNARTDWTYDGIGRVTRIEKPQFTDFEGTLNVRPTTDTEYNGLNNVVREIERGKNNASEADDRITQYVYGAGGYLSSEIDPTGAVTEYAIDVMGRFTREVLKNRQNAAGTVSTDDVTRYRYDLMGRQTHTIDGGTYNSAVRGTGYINESGYNAFGDVIGKRSYVGTAPTTWQEFAEYDKAGRVWKTNSGDGITKVHVHDANGNTTLTFTGPNITANLSRTESLQQTGSYSINVYDERNFFVGTRHPTTKSIEDMVTVIPADQSPGAAVVTKDQSTTIEKSAAQSTSQSLFSGDVEASRLIISETRVSSVVNGDANLKNMAISGQFNGSVINSRYGAGKIEIQTNWVYNYNSNLPTQRVDYFDIDSGVFSIPAFAAKFYFQSVVSVTTKFFVKTDYGRVLLYTNTQSNYSTLHPPATNNYSFTVNDRISFGNQPPDTDLLIVNYRLASSAPSGAWSSLVASQATSDDGNQIPGFLYLSKNQFLNGLYEIDYSALNSKGVVLNRQSGTLDLRLSFSPYIASGPNGTGSVGVGSTFSEAREVTQPSSQISYVKNMEIRGVFDPDYIRSRYGNGNIEVQTSWRYLNNSTQNNRTDVFSSASGQYSVAGVPVHNFIYVVNLTTKVYINTPSGKVLLYTNAQDYSQYPVVSVTNYSFLIANDIAIRAEPASASSMIFYYRMRPAGSDGAWLSAVASKVFSDTGVHIPGHFSVPRGLLQSYAYEFRAVTLDASGSILNEQYGEIDFRDPNSRIIMRPFSQQTQIGARGMITTDGRLQMLEQGAGSVAAASLVLRYRIKAATGDWIAVESATTGNALSLRRGNVLLGDLAGWFSLDVNSSAFVTGTEYEFDLESRDANGNVLTRARADFTRPATGTATISEFTGYAPTTVTFTSVRNASSMKVGYRAASSTGAYTYVTLTANPAGSGRFAWDTSLADDPRQSYPLDIETLAFDADGVLIHKSTATVTLGKDASVANATDVPVPQVLRAAAPAGTHTFTLAYRHVGSNGAYTPYMPITGTLYTAGGLNEVRADLPSGLDYGNYQYRLEAFSSSSASLGVSTSAFQKLPVVDAPPVLSWVLSEAGAQTTQSQRYNAFGEIIQSTDARGFVTDFEYNAVGQLVLKREPQTDITLANGYKYQARPETRYAYDAAGRLVAVTDANNHTNTQSWLNGADDESQIVLKRQADTGRERFEFDVFGQLRERINQLWNGTAPTELNHRTDYAYDKAGRLTSVTHEQRSDAGNQNLRAVDTYAYDAAGNRVRHTNALNKSADTAFDSLGRVVRYQSYGNTVNTYGYQWDGTIAGLGGAGGGGWVKTETDALSRTLIDKIDLYGRSRWHQDLGGRQFAYTYNNLGWLTAQARTDQTGGQDIVFDHDANGFVKSIWDRALGTWTEYRYDDAGNKTYESYLKLKDRLDPTKGAADYHQYATIEYDALNRISKITDPKATIEYEYDAVGNRRRLFSSYHDGVTGARTTQEYWYAYDAMNRFTVTMGRLGSNNTRGTAATGGPVIGTGTEGVALSYNAASQRVQATEANGVVQKYGYTTDGYLLTIRNGSDALTGNRVLDRAGRVTLLESWMNGVRSATETLYDDDSRVQSEKLYEGTTHKSTTSYFYFETIGQAAASAQPGGKGELARIVNTPAPGVTGTTLTWSHTYEYWDEAKQNGITVTGSNPALKHHNQYWAAGYTTLSYDVNGHVTAGSDAAGSRTFRYLTNAQGLILTSDELVGSTVNKVTRFQFIDGRPVGEITNDPERRRVDYVQELANKKADKKDYKNWKPIASADFDQNYEPIGERYPGGVAGSYTVRNGDTLASIARAVWGDAAMWYLIADANGLTGSEALTADTVLTLPNKVTNIHNNSTTFRPYNPAEAMGDVSPTLPDAPPPPRKKKKCGGLGVIIVAVVAVVATAAVVGALSGASGLSAISTGFNVMGGVAGAATAGTLGATNLGLAMAIGGAVGSVAGQLTGMAVGVQDKFSWGAVATSALTTALAPQITPFGKGSESWAIAGNAAARSVVNQGINIVAGQQKGFSWAGVAASAIAAPIMHKVGNALFGESDGFGNRTAQWTKDSPLVAAVAESTVNALISATTHIAIVGGKVQWAAVAADSISGFMQSRAFGSALGQSLASEMSKPSHAEQMSRQIQGQAVSNGFAATSLQMLAESDDLSADRLRSVLAKGIGEDQAAMLVTLAETYGPDGLRQLAERQSQQWLKQSEAGLTLAGAVMNAGGLDISGSYSGAAAALRLNGQALEALAMGRTQGLSADDVASLRGVLSGAGLADSSGRMLSVASAGPLNALGEVLGEVAPYVGAIYPAAGAAVGGVAMAIETLEQLPEMRQQVERLKSLVNLDQLSTFGAAGIPGLENDAVQKVFGEAMETTFRVINKLEDKLVGMLKNSPNRILKSAGIAVSGSLNQVKARGIVSEELGKFMMDQSGLFEADSVHSVQNKSGHGIDILAKAKYGAHHGKWIGLEVKTTSGTAGDISFTDGQRAGADFFIRRTLGNAANERGPRWWPWESERGTRAQEILNEMPASRRFEGYVLQVTKVNSPDPKVLVYDWNQIGRKK